MQKINEILYNLEKNKNILDPQVKKVPAYDFYAIEKEGKYAEIPYYYKELAKRIGDKNFTFTYFVIFKEFLEYEYSPSKSVMVIGAKPSKNISLRPKKNVMIVHTPRHTALTSFHKGSHASLGYVWEFMWEYFQENKFAYDQKIFARELYIKNPENEKYEENYITELQIPITKSPMVQYAHG